MAHRAASANGEQVALRQIEEAIALLKKANANVQPERVETVLARRFVAAFAQVQNLGSFGVAAFSCRVDDPAEVARVTGVSMGRAKDVVATGAAMKTSPDLASAMKKGALSQDQAAEISKAEEAAPGAAGELLRIAKSESFHVLREKARKARLQALATHDLFARQREARSARRHTDEMGMINVHLRWQPHVGAPLVARAEAEAERLARAAKADSKNGGPEPEPFERYLVDAYAALLAGANGRGRTKRPELVVLVSHDVARRGWTDVREGEVCKIPGIGPVSPQVAKEVASDAFLNGVFFDGKDLRHLKRWSRDIPVEVRLALELGPPPGFDGVVCADCGNRFRTEMDHVQPHVARGPVSTKNLEPRCWSCHREKTTRDLRAGRLRAGPSPSGPPRAAPARR
jgi:hypothetical protein